MDCIGGLDMRRLQISLPAAIALIGFAPITHAADMAVKALPPSPPIVAAYSWTGFYVGGNVGYGWGTNRSVNYSPNDPASAAYFAPAVGGAPPATSFKDSSVLGGLQLGYNWQFNRNWLVGLETDFDWSGLKGSGSSSGIVGTVYPFSNTVNEKVDWFGTVRARLGYLPIDNLLTYITGGLAYGRIDHTGNYFINGPAPAVAFLGGFGFTCLAAGPAPCFSGSSSSTATGWTMGAGFEYALLKNVTLKAEYLYVNLGNHSITQSALLPFGTNALSSFNANYGNTAFNVVRAGFNYRF
jgi:outer membrane immunogenic protein